MRVKKYNLADVSKEKKCANPRCGKSIYKARLSRGIESTPYQIRIARCCCNECLSELYKMSSMGRKNDMTNGEDTAISARWTHWKDEDQFQRELEIRIISQWHARYRDEIIRRLQNG